MCSERRSQIQEVMREPIRSRWLSSEKKDNSQGYDEWVDQWKVECRTQWRRRKRHERASKTAHVARVVRSSVYLAAVSRVADGERFCDAPPLENGVASARGGDGGGFLNARGAATEAGTAGECRGTEPGLVRTDPFADCATPMGTEREGAMEVGVLAQQGVVDTLRLAQERKIHPVGEETQCVRSYAAAWENYINVKVVSELSKR